MYTTFRRMDAATALNPSIHSGSCSRLASQMNHRWLLFGQGSDETIEQVSGVRILAVFMEPERCGQRLAASLFKRHSQRHVPGEPSVSHSCQHLRKLG